MNFSVVIDAFVSFTNHCLNTGNHISIEYFPSLSEVSICYVSGDPHYRTFDGLPLHYQGVCRYNLASPQLPYRVLPYFRVFAKSERRHGNEDVAYTRYVDIEIFGYTVRLDKGKNVYVSGLSEKGQFAPNLNYHEVGLV